MCHCEKWMIPSWGFSYRAVADVSINASSTNTVKNLKDHKRGWNQVLPCVPSKEKGITISLKHDIAAFSPWAFVLGNVPEKLPWKLVSREEQCCLILSPQYIMRCPGRQTWHSLLHLCSQSLPGFPFRHNFLADFLFEQCLNKILSCVFSFLPQNKAGWMHKTVQRI